MGLFDGTHFEQHRVKLGKSKKLSAHTKKQGHSLRNVSISKELQIPRPSGQTSSASQFIYQQVLKQVFTKVL